MKTHMITRNKNGCITGRALISVSVILYKNELIKFIEELNKAVKFGKSFRTLTDFQKDFITEQRKARKQRSINQYKKSQLKWK